MGKHTSSGRTERERLCQPPLLTFDPDLQDVLAEDHFDAESDKEHAAKDEPLTPFEPTEDKT